MTVRRLNYTGRRRIAAGDVSVDLVTCDGADPQLRADLRLGGYGLPGDAHVFVEAYHQTVRVPFCFGTVDNLKAPDDLSIPEFRETPELARFRVRVTDLTNVRGLLLAEVSGISPRSEEAGEAESLLEVKPAPLGNVPFRVDFSGERVRLEINNKIPNWHSFTDSLLFKSFAGPILIREILGRILHIENECDPDGPNWTNKWLKLAITMPGSPGPPPEAEDRQTAEEKSDDIDEWVDDVVRSFCERQESLTNLLFVLSKDSLQ